MFRFNDIRFGGPMKRQLLIAVAGALALAAAAQAGDVAPYPESYEKMASDYAISRLDRSEGARVQVVSEPYRVVAEVNGKSDLEGWGVDIRLKSRQASGASGVALEYTVIFVDGVAVALCDDTKSLKRL
jgi:opacity protein-like surface antigen